jgi:cytochrome c-type biogenesis protein CcmH
MEGKMKRKLTLILGLWLVLAFAIVGSVLAQEPEPSDDEVNAIAKQLYCPVCENIPLDVCPTQACEQWRATIRDKLTIGWSEEQIKQYFADQYGDRVLATPPARGLNWIIYVLPPVVIAFGSVFLIRAFRSWTKVEGDEPKIKIDKIQPQDPYVTRLEEELSRRESG